MEFSQYQLGIFEHVKAVADGRITNGKRHARVDALAGCAKSTTAKETLRYIPQNARVLFVAFNRLIADALAPEVSKLHPQAKAQTLHSFGFATLGMAVRGLRLNKYKTDDILQQTQFDMNDRNQKNLYFRLRNPIKRIVSLLKLTCQYATPETINQTIEAYGIEIPTARERVVELVTNVFGISLSAVTEMAEIDYDDMVAAPTYLKLTPKKYDWVIVDEFQDLNLAQYNLVYGAGHEGTIMTYGDPHQAIYGFTGAHSGIMDMFRDGFGATVLPLSVCYRCPKKVLVEARNFVPEIEDAPDAIDGNVQTLTMDKFEHLLPEIEKPVVVCRFTAPLVSWCLKMIRAGHHATVKGRELGQNLAALAEKINISTLAADYLCKVNTYKSVEMERLNRLNREDLIEEFNDKIDTILAVIASLEGNEPVTVGAVVTRIGKIFSDEEQKDGILFSTIHRVKGLGFKDVFILRTKKKAKATTTAQKQEELNLQYVAITRSQENLYFVNL